MSPVSPDGIPYEVITAAEYNDALIDAVLRRVRPTPSPTVTGERENRADPRANVRQRAPQGGAQKTEVEVATRPRTQLRAPCSRHQRWMPSCADCATARSAA